MSEEPVEDLSTVQVLTAEESEWLNERWFQEGHDTDTCDPQLNHIVFPLRSDKVEALCSSPSLWFYGSGFAPGTNLRCRACYKALSTLRRDSVSFYSQDMDRRRQRSDLYRAAYLLLEACKEVGRPDLALLLNLVQVSLFAPTLVSENALRDVLRFALTRKFLKLSSILSTLDED